MPKPVHWTSLVVGYETLLLQQNEPMPDHQAQFRSVFGSALETWGKPGSTTVADNLDTNPVLGTWVAQVLQSEIDRAIDNNGHSHKPRVVVGPWVRLIDIVSSPQPMFAGAPIPTGREGVRCEQTADGWRNSVTHVLMLNDRPWPTDSPVIGLATLNWACPGHNAESNLPTLRDVLEKAARSRGVGRVGGA